MIWLMHLESWHSSSCCSFPVVPLAALGMLYCETNGRRYKIRAGSLSCSIFMSDRSHVPAFNYIHFRQFPLTVLSSQHSLSIP